MTKAITLTLNPAIDRTVILDSLNRGGLNRAKAVRVDPGGKGINVARVARRLGAEVIAIGLLPATGGDLIRSSLDAEGISWQFLEIPGEVRCNLKIVEEDGTQTEVNEPGPQVTESTGRCMADRVLASAAPGDVVVLAGSLPHGLEPGYYAGLTASLKARGVMTVLDTDGEALRLGVAAGPTLVKPNRREAETLLDRAISGIADASQAARKICALGAETTVISLGAEGAVLASREICVQAAAPIVETRGTVGSGDAMVAALVCGLLKGLAPSAALRLAVAAGTASASQPGTAACLAEDVARLESMVRVEE